MKVVNTYSMNIKSKNYLHYILKYIILNEKYIFGNKKKII